MLQVFKELQDLHSGLKTSCRSTIMKTSSVSSHLSTPEPLRSEDSSLDSLTHKFSKLCPQENTCPCLHKPVFPSLSSAVTQSEESGWNAESWASQSSGMPCESDESQGFSHYLSNPCSTSQPSPCGACNNQSTKSDGSLLDDQSQSNPNGGNEIFNNSKKTGESY